MWHSCLDWANTGYSKKSKKSLFSGWCSKYRESQLGIPNIYFRFHNYSFYCLSYKEFLQNPSIQNSQPESVTLPAAQQIRLKNSASWFHPIEKPHTHSMFLDLDSKPNEPISYREGRCNTCWWCLFGDVTDFDYVSLHPRRLPNAIFAIVVVPIPPSLSGKRRLIRRILKAYTWRVPCRSVTTRETDDEALSPPIHPFIHPWECCGVEATLGTGRTPAGGAWFVKRRDQIPWLLILTWANKR